ncbi:Aste57867_10488 [Aphanomyces stellatus]|uniref:Aste57867_10488 protein n=1 Tax=Aphanomyces stellatus TaxID=120398 RepID=A0A485KR58_9STRA|nr:hypothetical protein As57867_010448 [Aphanomyces stellatus]VFT87362.1 Aste57867_10488 [Aphanomyces stellatus]
MCHSPMFALSVMSSLAVAAALTSDRVPWTCLPTNKSAAFVSWRIDVAGVLSCAMNDQTKDCLVVPSQQVCRESLDDTRPIKSCAAADTSNPSTLCGQAFLQLTSPSSTAATTTDPPNKLTSDWRCFKTSSTSIVVVVRLNAALQTECLSKDRSSCLAFGSFNDCRAALGPPTPFLLDGTPLSCAQLASPADWCVAPPPTTPPPSATPSSASSSPHTTLIAIAALGAGVVVCVALLMRFFYVTRRRPRSASPTPSGGFGWTAQPATSRVFLKGTSTTLSADHVKLGDLVQWRLDETQLQTISQLHMSSTGVISLGRYDGAVVVIKQPLESDRTFEIMQAFVEEIELMIRYGTTMPTPDPPPFPHRGGWGYGVWVQSPHIVHIVGVAYMRLRDLSLVLEYMERGDLQTYLATTAATRGALFPWSSKTAVLQDVLQALVHLHSLGVIHRDVKARNVLLSHDATAKLTDFGVARRLSATATMTQGIGSFQWTAPEVLEGGQYTTKADMYSIGVLLGELDSHAAPAEEDLALRNDSRHATLSGDCPARLRKLAVHCLANDPESRPTAAHALQLLGQ